MAVLDCVIYKFRYLGVTVTNTNDIREKIKRRINVGNVCYYSLEKIKHRINLGNVCYYSLEKIKRRINLGNVCYYSLEKIKHRINMGNACYYSLDKILSSRLLSKKMTFITYKTLHSIIYTYYCILIILLLIFFLKGYT